MTKKKRKDSFNDTLLNVLGIFLIAFGLFAMFYSVLRGQPIWIFWMCYIGMVIMGIGTIMRSGVLVLSQLNLLTIPLLMWDADFISIILFGKSIFGLSDYFFDELLIGARIISLEHLFVIPLGIFVLYMLKVKSKGAWKISTLQATMIFIILRIIGDTTNNMNCVFRNCIDSFQPTPYILWWFGAMIALVLITNFIYIKLFNKFFVER